MGLNAKQQKARRRYLDKSRLLAEVTKNAAIHERGTTPAACPTSTAAQKAQHPNSKRVPRKDTAQYSKARRTLTFTEGLHKLAYPANLEGRQPLHRSASERDFVMKMFMAALLFFSPPPHLTAIRVSERCKPGGSSSSASGRGSRGTDPDQGSSFPWLLPHSISRSPGPCPSFASSVPTIASHSLTLTEVWMVSAYSLFITY